WSTQPISAYMAGTATGGTAINGSSCIIGVLAFAGSGWIGMFHGAVDNVTLSAGGTELVNANFETAAPADAGTVAVPTLGEWGLALTAMLLGGLGIWRRRPGARG
ncbi:MAG: IPTL-CTERM sorting domain-containing protein, partial [Ottowia sp.]|nr:IPTL-CTERM sorting domain-containing protein [Ottowia sp.]